MTKQEYYDLLVKSAYDGTFPSEKNSVCYYRVDSTAKCKKRCAIGLLIPDDVYKRNIEGRPVRSIEDYITVPYGLSVYQLGLIQRLHDYNTRNKSRLWKAALFVEGLNDSGIFDDCALTPSYKESRR